MANVGYDMVYDKNAVRRKYYNEHYEQEQAYQKAYYQKNRKMILNRNKKYHESHKEVIRQYQKEYYQLVTKKRQQEERKNGRI